MRDEGSAGDMLQVLEALLTAEIFNHHEQLDANDLTPVMRVLFGVDGDAEELKRPVTVSESGIARTFGIRDAKKLLGRNPFVKVEDFGQRFCITALDPAAKWFLSQGGEAFIRSNPVLAFFYSHHGIMDLPYEQIRRDNPPIGDSRASLDRRVADLLKEDETLKNALDLFIASAPQEVDQRLDELVCTKRQEEAIAKLRVALAHREFLRSKRIYELGKMLFVGPPGTGKTSLALALSKELHMPVLEVRLSMITSQYLGETSKNIDRVFDFAKRISPCILFIDEFDFVAKSRITDDHGAMKRAVNMLLKNIDRTSLVRDGVLLIAATNHPQLLDEAAWRRFDDVVEFPMPDEGTRRMILEKILQNVEHDCDLDILAVRTEGFSGADLRVMVKEGLISALSRSSGRIGMEDIQRGLSLIQNRNRIRAGE
ncbi:MAG: ATP-binding protein [Methanomicrobiales archaeon]|nr:ATP-binding protein [Methanomicrobiales archaeon]